jgi:hypothetical protein
MWGFGIALLLTGMVALLLSGGLDEPRLGSNEDPGPRALPVLLASCLALGGVVELVRCWRLRMQDHGRTSSAPRGREGRCALLGDRATRDRLVMLGGMVLYVAAIPWAGFSLSTWLFALGGMRRMGVGWLLAAGVATGLVAVIYAVFVRVFRVQFPPGVLGVPF